MIRSLRISVEHEVVYHGRNLIMRLNQRDLQAFAEHLLHLPWLTRNTIPNNSRRLLGVCPL
jgi:hypothetical protein